jgi:sugar lactone lactonase YvrE
MRKVFGLVALVLIVAWTPLAMRASAYWGIADALKLKAIPEIKLTAIAAQNNRTPTFNFSSPTITATYTQSPTASPTSTVSPTPSASPTPLHVYAFAGNGTPGYSGDGASASAAKLSGPFGVATDLQGNVYIADFQNSVVRRVDSAGNITTVAGIGVAGYSGDNGPATAAALSKCSAVSVNTAGELFIADSYNNVIRKVDLSGTITTFAGKPVHPGNDGDGGLATSAHLDFPTGVSNDLSGNVFVVDTSSAVVRMINSSGIIATVAGTPHQWGYSGDGGPATAAKLQYPWGIAVDYIGNLFISDHSNDVVRKVDTAGTITTVAGIAGSYGYFGDNGPAIGATIYGANGVAVDAFGNLYIADTQNNIVRKVDNNGRITTIAGHPGLGLSSGNGGLATSSMFVEPTGIAVDQNGSLYIADMGGNVVRVIK